MNIKGFIENSAHCKYTSVGVYGMTPNTIKTLETCIEEEQITDAKFSASAYDR